MQEKPELFIYLLDHELKSMPDYTSSNPSAQTPGKVWRCTAHYFANAEHDMATKYLVRIYGEPFWKEVPRRSSWSELRDGKYMEQYSPIWQFTVIRLEGPEPPGWRPPDWSNMARYRRDRDARTQTEEAQHGKVG